ncbi:hypothetical protein T12_12751 [Trichinella patagoniensis]|uniref:Uncharacterized protein n=1 Tax=Trichinella patagoniensis TaxID=990121 RepID=A0A0V0ZQG3_9BILA|nr:hypothetical protein T12_12751 [Trichinella patagoniensis]
MEIQCDENEQLYESHQSYRNYALVLYTVASRDRQSRRNYQNVSLKTKIATLRRYQLISNFGKKKLGIQFQL